MPWGAPIVTTGTAPSKGLLGKKAACKIIFLIVGAFIMDYNKREIMAETLMWLRRYF